MYNRGGLMCPPAKTTLQGKLHADTNIFGYRAGTQACPLQCKRGDPVWSPPKNIISAIR